MATTAQRGNLSSTSTHYDEEIAIARYVNHVICVNSSDYKEQGELELWVTCSNGSFVSETNRCEIALGFAWFERLE